LEPAEIEVVLREVGRTLAAEASTGSEARIESRVQRAVKVLEAIGGSAEVEQRGDKIAIVGNSCPLAAAVTVHPEVCRLAETLVAEIVKVPVEEHCDREERPRCCFEISRG
jgi:predicted ArsR family transcriptional regulator